MLSLTFGYSRKKIGKMHKDFYARRLAKARRSDLEAFQKTMVSTIKATLDVVDANNKKLTNDIMKFLQEQCKIDISVDGVITKVPTLPEPEAESDLDVVDERSDYNAYYGDEEDMRAAMSENDVSENEVAATKKSNSDSEKKYKKERAKEKHKTSKKFSNMFGAV